MSDDDYDDYAHEAYADPEARHEPLRTVRRGEKERSVRKVGRTNQEAEGQAQPTDAWSQQQQQQQQHMPPQQPQQQGEDVASPPPAGGPAYHVLTPVSEQCGSRRWPVWCCGMNLTHA
jgi:hypothetical protein